MRTLVKLSYLVEVLEEDSPGSPVSGSNEKFSGLLSSQWWRNGYDGPDSLKFTTEVFVRIVFYAAREQAEASAGKTLRDCA